MCFCFYDADIDSVMSTSRTTCASPCLAISAANSKVIIVSPLIPALGVPITAKHSYFFSHRGDSSFYLYFGCCHNIHCAEGQMAEEEND